MSMPNPSRSSRSKAAKAVAKSDLVAPEKPDFGEMLSPELWLMIFEIMDSDQWLSNDLRLVSQRFNALTTPLVYRHFYRLSNRLIASRPDPLASRVVAHIKAHSRTFSIPKNLKWYRLVKFLSDCNQFQELIFSWLSSSSPLPTAIQVALREEWHHVRIHLDITYNKYLPAEQNLALIIESIPPTNLALLRVDACPLEPQTTAKLNTLLASSKNLKTLCMLPGWHFSATCGRMPPITFLLLEQEKESSTPNHEWPYTPGQVVEIWDFSQLHELRLTGFDVRSFIKSVPASSLVSLRNLELRLEPKSRSHTTDEQVDMDISNFIQGIPQLEELSVTCCFLTYIADSVSKHQKTLRKLALVNTNTHDYVKWNAREDLQKIQSSCPLLMNLFVGLPFLKEDTITNDYLPDLFGIFSSFKNLRDLTIHATANHARKLWESGIGNTFKDTVCLRKEGAQIEYLRLLLTTQIEHPSYFHCHFHCQWDNSGNLTEDHSSADDYPSDDHAGGWGSS